MNTSKPNTGWVRWARRIFWLVAKIGWIMALLIVVPSDNAHAKTVGEVLCDRYCGRVLEPALDRAEDLANRVRQRLHGEPILSDPIPAPNRGRECGITPTGATKCCDPSQRLMISHTSWANPYTRRDIGHQAVCIR